MAGRPVRRDISWATRRDVATPPGAPPLTWKMPVPSSASTLPRAQRSASGAAPAGALRGRAEPKRAGPHAVADQLLHSGEFLRRGLGTLRGCLTHHIAPDPRMAN